MWLTPCTTEHIPVITAAVGTGTNRGLLHLPGGETSSLYSMCKVHRQACPCNEHWQKHKHRSPWNSSETVDTPNDRHDLYNFRHTCYDPDVMQPAQKIRNESIQMEAAYSVRRRSVCGRSFGCYLGQSRFHIGRSRVSRKASLQLYGTCYWSPLNVSSSAKTSPSCRGDVKAFLPNRTVSNRAVDCSADTHANPPCGKLPLCLPGSSIFTGEFRRRQPGDSEPPVSAGLASLHVGLLCIGIACT